MGYPIYVKYSKIYEAIDEEVTRAITKFPTWPTDPLHAKAVLDEEVGELEQAILECIYEPQKSNKIDVEKEAIQAAAMCIRFLKSLHKYKYEPSEQHKQD